MSMYVNYTRDFKVCFVESERIVLNAYQHITHSIFVPSYIENTTITAANQFLCCFRSIIVHQNKLEINLYVLFCGLRDFDAIGITPR